MASAGNPRPAPRSNDGQTILKLIRLDPGQHLTWSFSWAQLGSNQRPLACKASALPLSYAPWPRAQACPGVVGGNRGQRTRSRPSARSNVRTSAGRSRDPSRFWRVGRPGRGPARAPARPLRPAPASRRSPAPGEARLRPASPRQPKPRQLSPRQPRPRPARRHPARQHPRARRSPGPHRQKRCQGPGRNRSPGTRPRRACVPGARSGTPGSGRVPPSSPMMTGMSGR
jgi:hypothetical protein